MLVGGMVARVGLFAGSNGTELSCARCALCAPGVDGRSGGARGWSRGGYEKLLLRFCQEEEDGAVR